MAFKTVKIREDGFVRLKKLVEAVARNGWAITGVDRSDAASNTSVMEAALIVLEKQVKKSR